MSFFKWLHQVSGTNLNKAGIYNYGGHNLLLNAIEKKSRIIDLGANKGGFYSLISKKFDCICYAIEASPQLFAALPVNNNIHTYNYAVGKDNGFVELYLSNEPEANSLHHTIASNWGIIGKATIPSITLEKFLDDQKIELPLNLLKIDIEGTEIDVINNSPNHILNQIKQIPVEFHDFLIHSDEYKIAMHKAIAKLKQNNFIVARFSPYDFREILCINKSLIKLKFRQKVRLYLIHPFLRNMIFFHTVLRHFFNAHK